MNSFWTPSTSRFRLSRALAFLIGLVCISNVLSLQAFQTISPSTTPGANARNLAAQQANGKNIEPSQRLLNVMNTMIPFDVLDTEFEDPLRKAARRFLAGSINESIAILDDLKLKRADFPPSTLLVSNMLFAAGNLPQCKKWLDQTVTESPDHPSAYLGFARFAITEKRIADSDAMLEKAERVVQAGADSWTEQQDRLFRIELLDIQTDIHINRRQLKEARLTSLDLQKLMPQNSRVPVRLAQIEFDLKNVDGSLFQLREARKLNSTLRVPEIIIGEWFLRKGDRQQSENWMKLAASEYPENLSVQVDYSRWLLQSERIEEARSSLSVAEKLGAEQYILDYLKGQLAFAERSYDLAEIHFEAILSTKPGDADATNMLSLCLLESADQRKRDRALELAMMNLRMYPNSPTATATLGWAYHRLGKQPEAENAFRKVIGASKLTPVAAYYVAEFLFSRGDMPGAKNLLDQAISSKEYFMFRKAAQDLLVQVEKRTEADKPVRAKDPFNSSESQEK